MADFQIALTTVLKHEGGYVNDPVDLGGETYRGVARKMHPNWPGWVTVDSYKQMAGFPANLDGDQQLQIDIGEFYRINFWIPVKGDGIYNQKIAASLFDFCVNTGVKTGVKIAQRVLGVADDGIVGPITLGRLNSMDPELFLSSFTVAKIARYVELVKNRPANSRFFYGWVRRAIGDI